MDFAGEPTANSLLQNFWPRIGNDIGSIHSSDFGSKNPELPLARIKKIMKLDDEVKMISGEAPIIFAKAAELFIQEVTIRAWQHTEENKRRTLQKNDVTLAISKHDDFDFLIDIVPREEKKPAASTKKETNSPTSGFTTTTANPTNTANSAVPSVLNGITDQSAQSFLNAINSNGVNGVQSTNNGSSVLGGQAAAGSCPSNENVQYYFTMPGDQNNFMGQQGQQGLNLQNLQGLQGIQGMQGAQIVIGSNGQPTLFVGNREGCL